MQMRKNPLNRFMEHKSGMTTLWTTSIRPVEAHIAPASLQRKKNCTFLVGFLRKGLALPAIFLFLTGKPMPLNPHGKAETRDV